MSIWTAFTTPASAIATVKEEPASEDMPELEYNKPDTLRLPPSLGAGEGHANFEPHLHKL